MVDEYESELEGSRNDVATALRDVADGLVAGSVRLGDGEDAIVVDVAEELSLEIEFEPGDDEIELELEVVWPRSTDGEDVTSTFEPPSGANEGGSTDPSQDSAVSADDDVPVDDDVPADDVVSEDGNASADEGVRADADHPGDGDVPAAAEVGTSPVVAADGSGTMAGFEVFRDRADEWRWRLRHRNGNVIATSGEGYTRKHNATKGLRSVVQNAPGAEITDETDD